MFRKLKLFFVISLTTGVVSLVFFLVYSTRSYNTFNESAQKVGLKYIGIIKTRIQSNSEGRQITGNNNNLDNDKTLATRTVPTTLTINPTSAPKSEETVPSKISNGGDKVDQLIETSLEKGKPELHSEGDEPVDATNSPIITETPSDSELGTDAPSDTFSKPPPDEDDEDLELCPAKPPTLTGPLFVNQIVPKMEELEKHLSESYGGWVQKGGSWRPTQCKARVKMALIIPFRKRYEQLGIFVRHMHPMLKRQELDYRIIIVEQSGDTPFNRAILFNIGYKESLKFKQFDCFIFHDVDLIPEDDRNMYNCPTSPRHMSVAVDKFNYRLPYATIFGGAGAFKRKDFEEVNGFSNKFWGWGGEDDDLYQRIVAKGHHITRPSLQIGRYKMIRLHHHQSSKADPNRFELLRDSSSRMPSDGLSSLNYKLLEVKEHLLYTLVTIHVDRSMIPS